MAEGEEAAAEVKEEGEFIKEEPTYIPLGDKHYKYGCPTMTQPHWAKKMGWRPTYTSSTQKSH